MDYRQKGHGSLWGIVLAGGEGERLREFVRMFIGAEAPKQFCSFVGRRTMLEHTLRRAETCIPPEHLVVVASAHHRPYLFTALGDSRPGHIVLQPCGRDTGPGILLPLIHVLHDDPHALVALLPSDHFISPGRRFMDAIRDVAMFLDRSESDALVLLGIDAVDPEPDYGWLEPGSPVGWAGQTAVRRVNRFVEKPSGVQAARLMADGWLWNSMVMVARAQALWGTVQKIAPDLAAEFSRIRHSIGYEWEAQVLADVYRTLPSVNFSQAVLSHCPDQLLVVQVQDVLWSDWGRGERILATLARIGSGNRSRLSGKPSQVGAAVPRQFNLLADGAPGGVESLAPEDIPGGSRPGDEKALSRMVDARYCPAHSRVRNTIRTEDREGRVRISGSSDQFRRVLP